jgi:hypothetical protein
MLSAFLSVHEASAWDNLLVRIEIDIPKHLRLRLRERAKAEGTTVEELIIRALETFLTIRSSKPPRVKLPIIRSKRPGTLDLDNEKIFEIIDFP